MKPVVIIAIAVGVSVVAILGVLIGIGTYQQAQLEKEQREANQAFINLMQKVAESEQKQSTPPLPSQGCSGSAGCFTGYVTEIIDGDTIVVDGTHIRLALTSTPCSLLENKSACSCKLGSSWKPSTTYKCVGNVSGVTERGGVNQLPQKQNHRSLRCLIN